MTQEGLQDGGAAHDPLAASAPALDLDARAAVVRALDHRDIQPLVDVLHRMPLALARCLKAANSAHFARVRQVGTPAVALEVLGGRSAAMIVLSASYDHGAAGRWSPAQEALRRHGVQMAVLAAQLCHALDRPQMAEMAYVAALLHDVNTLQPDLRSPAFGDAGGAAVKSDIQRTAAQLREWRLPVALVDAVLAIEPGADAQGPAEALTGAILRVAHRLADRLCDPVRATVEEIEKHAAALQTSRSTVIEAMRVACVRLRQLEGG